MKNDELRRTLDESGKKYNKLCTTEELRALALRDAPAVMNRGQSEMQMLARLKKADLLREAKDKYGLEFPASMIKGEVLLALREEIESRVEREERQMPFRPSAKQQPSKPPPRRRSPDRSSSSSSSAAPASQRPPTPPGKPKQDHVPRQWVPQYRLDQEESVKESDEETPMMGDWEHLDPQPLFNPKAETLEEYMKAVQRWQAR